MRGLSKPEAPISPFQTAASALDAFWASSHGSRGDLEVCRLALQGSGLSAQDFRRLKTDLPNLPEGCTTGNRIARLRDLLDELAASGS